MKIIVKFSILLFFCYMHASTRERPFSDYVQDLFEKHERAISSINQIGTIADLLPVIDLIRIWAEQERELQDSQNNVKNNALSFIAAQKTFQKKNRDVNNLFKEYQIKRCYDFFIRSKDLLDVFAACTQFNFFDDGLFLGDIEKKSPIKMLPEGDVKKKYLEVINNRFFLLKDFVKLMKVLDEQIKKLYFQDKNYTFLQDIFNKNCVILEQYMEKIPELHDVLRKKLESLLNALKRFDFSSSEDPTKTLITPVQMVNFDSLINELPKNIQEEVRFNYHKILVLLRSYLPRLQLAYQNEQKQLLERTALLKEREEEESTSEDSYRDEISSTPSLVSKKKWLIPLFLISSSALISLLLYRYFYKKK